MTGLETFIAVYKKHLAEQIPTNPHFEHVRDTFNQDTETAIKTVGDRMAASIERGDFNKDSVTFRKTCKELGIPHTYKAINEFIKG